MIVARITLQITKMEPLKNSHWHQQTLPQDQTISVHGDCNPQKIENIGLQQTKKSGEAMLFSSLLIQNKFSTNQNQDPVTLKKKKQKQKN